MTYQSLEFTVSDGVAVITLSRPDHANSLDKTLAGELYDAAVRCEFDDAIRAVVITGTGTMFCAGGDLKAFNGQGENLSAYLMETATCLHNAIIRFQHMDPPVVMAINGTAAGAGFSIALSGDYVIAAEGVKYVSAYTASGLTPDGSSTYFLAKHVGLLRAKELAMTNRVLGAEEALNWGMVNKIVPADQLMGEALALAKSFAAGPTKAFGQTKRLLLSAFNASIDTQLERETRGIVAMSQTHDGRHGIDSFANKKKPIFKGV
ncbi:MAG: enoyl-CoA hydratase/isomerase family protein [Fimbriimonadaceae bacterium]|nr:enoyl-CoA hydratase/isomerase family protein [Alphaproteobacteria bacterium]